MKKFQAYCDFSHIIVDYNSGSGKVVAKHVLWKNVSVLVYFEDKSMKEIFLSFYIVFLSYQPNRAAQLVNQAGFTLLVILDNKRNMNTKKDPTLKKDQNILYFQRYVCLNHF